MKTPNYNIPFSFWSFSKEFLATATLVRAPSKTTIEKQNHKGLIAYYLVGHSIELSLKSFLLATGNYDISVLRSRRYGHNLEKLLSQSQDENLSIEVELSENEIEAIILLSDTYKDKKFEYLEYGDFRLPQYWYIHKVGEKLVNNLGNFAASSQFSDSIREFSKKQQKSALSKDHLNLLEQSINDYSFPCVCYDFKNGCSLSMQNMIGVEEFIRKDLLGVNTASVKNGLSNVLYWGFAQIPYRDKRISIFRKNVTKEQLYDAMDLFRKMTGPGLQDIKNIGLPQYSGMSFISKVRMFLDPTKFVVLDQQILKMNNTPFNTVLKEIKFGTKETQIRISKKNTDVYQQWCEKCVEISLSIYNGKYRTVDVERGFFTLIQGGQVESAAEILSNA